MFAFIMHSVRNFFLVKHRGLLGIWDLSYHTIGAKIKKKKVYKAYLPSCSLLYKWDVAFIQVTEKNWSLRVKLRALQFQSSEESSSTDKSIRAGPYVVKREIELLEIVSGRIPKCRGIKWSIDHVII